MNKKELARAYGISVITFNRWIKPHLKKIGPQIGHLYTPKQLDIIFSIFGTPKNLNK
jgi:hypothetical protein